MPNKRYTFVLNFGYAEDATLSYMPWVSKQTFKDAKEALKDLALFLKSHYLKGNEKPLKKCCSGTLEKDGSSHFCTKCGTSLAPTEFEGEAFAEWVYELGFQNANDSTEYIEYDSDARWEAGYMEKTPNHRYVYQADKVLAAAVGFNHHNDITFDSLCKKRTKERRENFEYF